MFFFSAKERRFTRENIRKKREDFVLLLDLDSATEIEMTLLELSKILSDLEY